jgi:glyoxylase-like metal-dependent hydrolase (beta-lactamase superfamily II)
MSSTPRPRKQEQESARDEVSEVAPGVLRMELPIRMPGLGHVNCYALLDERGATLVDPGLPGPLTWRTLRARLARAGLRVRDVHTVIVTHSHPDHFGGAMRFARKSGARIVAHRAFRFGVSEAVHVHTRPEVSVDDLATQADAERERIAPGGVAWQQPPEPWGSGRTPWGGKPPMPPFAMRALWRVARRFGGLAFVPQISDPVEEGDVLRLAGREWFVVHTPGHTEDHFCLHDPEQGLFLAGDHVLPTITPHISGLTLSKDPLDTFFHSLDQAAAVPDVKLVLPAHGHPFTDLPARCEAIKQHHYDRLDTVKRIGRELGPATVQAFSQKLFKPRSWGEMAESETYAHLEHLLHRGEASSHRDEKGFLLYETA